MTNWNRGDSFHNVAPNRDHGDRETVFIVVRIFGMPEITDADKKLLETYPHAKKGDIVFVRNGSEHEQCVTPQQAEQEWKRVKPFNGLF